MITTFTTDPINLRKRVIKVHSGSSKLIDNNSRTCDYLGNRFCLFTTRNSIMNQSNCAADVIRNRINCTFNIYNSAFHSFEINSIEGCFPTHRIFKKYQLIILCCIFRIVFFFRTTRKRKVLFSLIINAFYAANQLFCFLNAVFCTTMLTLKHVVFFDNIRTAAQFTNHCLHGISSPLSLILFFHFTPPRKKSSVFLQNYIFLVFLTKARQIVVHLHKNFRLACSLIPLTRLFLWNYPSQIFPFQHQKSARQPFR